MWRQKVSVEERIAVISHSLGVKLTYCIIHTFTRQFQIYSKPITMCTYTTTGTECKKIALKIIPFINCTLHECGCAVQ